MQERPDPRRTREPWPTLWAISAVETHLPALFDEHYDEIASYVMRRLVDESSAEDIAQRTFVEAYDRQATYDSGEGDPPGLAIRDCDQPAAETLAIRGTATSSYGRAASREIQPQDRCEDICIRLDAAACQGAIARALASLSSGDRDVLTLFCLADLSYEEIASGLEIPTGTVKSRLNRARRQLRAQLDPGILEASDG